MRLSFVISKRILWQMKSNMRGLFVLFILPVILTAAVGMSTIYPFEDVKVAVVNLDEGYSFEIDNSSINISLAEIILDKINTTRLNLIPEENYSAAMNLLREGKVRAVIFFSPEFTKWALYEMNLTDDVPFSSFPYRLSLDDSYLPLALYIAGEVDSAVQKTVEDTFSRGNAEGLLSEFSYAERGSGSNYVYIFSVIMVITIFSVTLFNSSLIMLRERTQRTLDRLISADVTLWQFYLGYSISFLFLSLIQIVLFLLSMYLLVPDLLLGPISVAYLFLSMLLFSFVIQNTGMIISFLFRKEMNAIMSLPAVLMLTLMLGNVFTPPESFRGLISTVTAFNPMKYAMHSALFLVSGGDTAGVSGDILSMLLLYSASLLCLLLVTGYIFSGKKAR